MPVNKWSGLATEMVFCRDHIDAKFVEILLIDVENLEIEHYVYRELTDNFCHGKFTGVCIL